jgi:hypothetical protein
MRLIGNFYSEWVHDRGNFHHTLLVTLVACAVGATASAAVILSLASSPITQPGSPSISPRAIVRNVAASEPSNAAQDEPMVETTPSPGAIVRNAGASEEPKTAQDEPKVETAPRPAATGMVVNRDESVTQTAAEHQTEVHGHQSRKHGLVREPYRRRFAHNFSPKPFGSW